jgi:hypothetical protein
MARLEAYLMGAPGEAAVVAQPSDADCQVYLSSFEGACRIGLNAVSAKTAAKKKTAMADVEEFLGRIGKTIAESIPSDIRAYLFYYSSTQGTFLAADGKRFAAPSSVKARASFIATELDKNPTTAGLWNPHGNNGNGTGTFPLLA